MTAIAEKIEREIRQLPMEDLLALHERLIASIQEKEDTEKLDPAFRDDIERRVNEIDAGQVQGVEAFQALKEM